MTLEWCTLNDGVPFRSYNFIKRILDALYTAISNTFDVLDFFGIDFYIKLHDDVRVKVIDTGSLVDFRLPAKEFWAIRCSIFGYGVNVPLAKNLGYVTSNFLNQILSPINPSIDSAYFEFKDNEDVWKVGSEYSPTRKFYLLTDGIKAIMPLLRVGLIIWIFNKLGLFNLAKNFLIAWHNINAKLKVQTKLDKILSILESESTFSDIGDRVVNIDERLSEIDLSLNSRVLSLVGLKNILKGI